MMTPKQEAALRQALDCVSTLANARDWVGCTPNERWDEDEMYAELCNATICLKKSLSIIQEALAEQPAQQQEPVVWMYINRSTHETAFQKQMRSFVDHSQWKEVPLYSEPLANHEFQCVCGAVWCGDEMVHLPDKHPQPSKPWVGLTEEEIALICAECALVTPSDIYFARAIEAKLREKNAPQQSKEDA